MKTIKTNINLWTFQNFTTRSTLSVFQNMLLLSTIFKKSIDIFIFIDTMVVKW